MDRLVRLFGAASLAVLLALDVGLGEAAASDRAASATVLQPAAVLDIADGLVTDEELCTFRAPLALTGSGDVPEFCAETVEWLKRLATGDPACFALWLETGASPDCALPFR